MCTEERVLFDTFAHRIKPKIEEALLQHRTLFADNEPIGALESLLNVHRAVYDTPAEAAADVARLVAADARAQYFELRLAAQEAIKLVMFSFPLYMAPDCSNWNDRLRRRAKAVSTRRTAAAAMPRRRRRRRPTIPSRWCCCARWR